MADRSMANAPHWNDGPPSPRAQPPWRHGDARIADSGSGMAPTANGGPIYYPRRDHSLNVGVARNPAPKDWDQKHPQNRSPTLPPLSPSYALSAHPSHFHNNANWNSYEHRYYQSSSPANTPTRPSHDSSRDPRFRAYSRDSPTPSQPIPSPTVSSRWDSLAKPSAPSYWQAGTSAPTSPVAPSFTNESYYSANDAHRSIDSIASETRDEFPALPSARSMASEYHMPAPVENFSRPRVPSIKQSYHDVPHMRSPTQPIFENGPHDPVHNPNGPWPRSRGPSVSSNQSSSTFASLAIRPSFDSYSRDSPRGRAWQPQYPPSRMPLPYGRAESSRPNVTRDPIPRMASLPGEELRTSFRSQLSGSTAQGTMVTENSSLLTKGSSVASVYGNVDDSLSVDDVLGLYDKGFDDDSATEDRSVDGSPPPTATSESNQGMASELAVVAEVADTIPDSLSVLGGYGPVVRDSAAIFRVSSHPPLSGKPMTSKEKPPSSEATRPSSQSEFSPPPFIRHETNLTMTGEDARDRYGFKKANQYITTEEFDHWDDNYSKYLARRRRKWNAFLKENGLMTDSPNRFPPRSAKTKRFIRKGIPPDWRGAAWFYYAGGPAIVAKHAGLYGELLDCPAKEVDAEAIERDLHRTFPDNIRFRSSAVPSAQNSDEISGRESRQTTGSAQSPDIQDETPMISALRRVLYAFSIYNPRIGYCQSLNFLAGLLLLFVKSEEHAFWLLNIITRVYLPGTHEMSLEGANVDLGVLMASIRDTMPNIWAKIGGELDGTEAARPKRRGQRVELTTRLPPITLCMTAWFMSCFIGTLPIETTLRVWDVFFYEGSKTLFRVALTIFKIGEPEIKLVGDPMEIFQTVQTIPRKMLDANALLEACYKRRNGFGHLSQENIEQKRQDRRNYVKAEQERLANGETLTLVDSEVGRKGTLFKRKPRG